MRSVIRRHFALIPAKERSGRCLDKNWRYFSGGSLVDFTIRNIPDGMFDKVIISTDKADYRTPSGVEKHLRDKALASKDSCVKDLIQLIVREYGMSDEDYLWLLNPTSPFRSKEDYRFIKGQIEQDAPCAMVSVVKINPFIWEQEEPLFETKGKRRNTEDFQKKYGVENGMFYVFNVGHFCKYKSWYGAGARLYRQHSIYSAVDIDTEDDFKEACELARAWDKGRGGR